MPTSGKITRVSAILGSAMDEGRVFFVKPTTDTGYAEWFRKVRMSYPGGVKNVYNTVETAEDAMTSNNNDTMILGTHGSHAVAAEVAFDKNRMHIMGYDQVRGVSRLGQVQGAKITLATAVDEVSCAYFSGVRQTVRGVKFINSSTQSSALYSARLGGEGLYMEGCSFQFNTRLNQTTTWDVLAGTDTGEFVNCTFGNDAVVKTAANGNMLIDAISTPFKHTIIRDCQFLSNNTGNDSLHISVADTAAVNFQNYVKNCVFMQALVNSTSSIQALVAVSSVGSLVQGALHFENCSTNAASFATTADQFTIYGPEKPVAATTGIAVTPS